MRHRFPTKKTRTKFHSLVRWHISDTPTDIVQKSWNKMHCLESRCFAALIQRLYIGDHSRNPQVHSTDPTYSSAKRWISMNFGHSGHEECHLGAKMVPILPKWFSRFHDKERTNPVIHDPKNPSLEELSQAILIEATTRRVWPNQTDWGFGRRDNVDNEVSGFSGRFFAVKNSGRVLLR